MNQSKMLLRLEVKRAMKNLKKLMLGALAIALVLVVIVISSASLRKEKGITNKAVVFLVTNNNSVIDSVGMDVLGGMETAENLLDCKVLEEKEAMELFEKEEATAVIIFPNNYIDEIGRGDNIPAKVYLRSNGMAFYINIIAELCQAAGKFLGASESVSYAMDDMLYHYEVEEYRSQMVDDLDVISARVILTRDDTFDKITLVGEGDVSIVLGYACSAVIILILLWGLSCGTVLKSDSPVLIKKLEISLISIKKQVSFKYIALLFLMGSMLAILIGLLLVSYPLAKDLYLLVDIESFSQLLLLCLSFIPGLLLGAAIILASYGLADNQIGGTLLLFILTVSMGYCSGCLFPIIYLPKPVRVVGSYMPTFFMKELATSAARGIIDVKSLVIVLAYACAFYLLGLLIISYKQSDHIRLFSKAKAKEGRA